MYDDIINLPRHITKRKRMSIYNRSAQFAPFDALEGYSDEIKESERRVVQKIIISDEIKEKINRKLVYINSNKDKKVSITYFVPDKYKVGGRYKNVTSFIKKIDLNNRYLVLNDNSKILLSEIVDVKILL